jgi:hypothetical protein
MLKAPCRARGVPFWQQAALLGVEELLQLGALAVAERRAECSGVQSEAVARDRVARILRQRRL